jgi:23S rRNA pseudouridine1911/1915/1917 synthase
VNGGPAKASYSVKAGDRVVVMAPGEVDPDQARPAPEALPLAVIYEDDALLVVNKPAGMVVHPAPGHPGGTLVNALLARYPTLAGSGDDRPGIVHRLDRDTSGVIVIAKSEQVRCALQKQFQGRSVHKAYVALLYGHLEPARGRIEAPLGRDPHHRQRMAVLPGGREAATEYRVVEHLVLHSGPAAGDYTLVEALPQTGRTHQIRVHLASIGHPVVGDRVYGRRKARLPAPRQFLHASRLEIQHPVTGRRMEFEAPLPPDLTAVLVTLRGT